jgi:hypothetical protein
MIIEKYANSYKSLALIISLSTYPSHLIVVYCYPIRSNVPLVDETMTMMCLTKNRFVNVIKIYTSTDVIRYTVLLVNLVLFSLIFQQKTVDFMVVQNFYETIFENTFDNNQYNDLT